MAPISRRSFLRPSAAILCASLVKPLSAPAALACGQFNRMGIQECEAGIDSDMAGLSAQLQHASQWCWAACISMIFRYYDHPVRQARIVEETWGDIVNLPGQPAQIVD